MAPKIERTTPKAKNNDYVITYSTGAKKWTNDRPGDGVGDLEGMLDDLGVQRGLSAISKAIETGKGLKPAVDGMIRDTGTDKGQTVLNAVYKGMQKSKATDKKIEGWGNARKMVGNVRDVVKKIFKVFPVNKATEIAERLIKFNKTKDKKYDLTKEEQKKIYNRVDYGETLPLTKKRKIDIGWTDHGEYRSDLRDINPHEINEAITDKLKNRLNPPQKNTVKLKERGVGTMVVDFDTKKKPADATVVTVYGSENRVARKTQDFLRIEEFVKVFRDAFPRGYRNNLDDNGVSNLAKASALLKKKMVFNIDDKGKERIFNKVVGRKLKNFEKMLIDLSKMKTPEDWEEVNKKHGSKSKGVWAKAWDYSKLLLEAINALDVEVESHFKMGSYTVILLQSPRGDWDDAMIGRLAWILKTASSKIKSAGLGSAIGGKVFAYPTKILPSAEGHNALAYYHNKKNYIKIASDGNPNNVVNTLIHELGHRYYYVSLSSGGRQAWRNFFNTNVGNVDVDSIINRWEKWYEQKKDSGEYWASKYGNYLAVYWGELDKTDPEAAMWLEMLAGKLKIKEPQGNSGFKKNAPPGLEQLKEKKGEAKLFLFPVTAYSGTSPEELFAEVFANIIMKGTGAIPPIVREAFKMAVPSFKTASKVADTIAENFYNNSIGMEKSRLDKLRERVDPDNIQPERWANIVGAVMDRVNPEKIEALWYENEAGDKFYPDLSDNGYPDIPEGYIYQHFQDSALSHSVLKITQKDEVDTCDHPIDFMKVDHGLIPGLEGEKCEKCGGSRQRNVGDEWPEWEANGSQSVMTMNSGWPEDLVASMSAEGVPLNKAIMIAGNACERCMNSLAEEFGLDWGYPEMSDEWKKTRTECEYCRDLGYTNNLNSTVANWSKKMGNDDLANEVLKLADSLVADEYSDKRDRNVKYLEKKDKERKDEKKKKSLKKMNDKLLKRKESEGWTDEEYQKHKKRKETQLSKGDASPDVIEDIAKPAIKKVKKVIDKFRGKGKSKDKSKPKGKDEFTKSEWNDYKKKHPDTKIRPKIVGSIADRVAMSFSENKDLEDKFEKEVEKSKKLSGVDANIAKYLVESGLDDGDPSDDKISVSKKSVGASKLKPSQTTIRVEQVIGMALGMLKSGKIGGDLGALISGDNHILDGHHRWAAAILAGGSSPKVGGYQASMPGKDFIKVLNIMTKGQYGRQKGNAGSGNISDVNPNKVKKLLESYADKGVGGDHPISADKVSKILEDSFGSVEKGIDKMSSNAKRVSKQVPSWAQNRTDMPVIKPSETGGAASLLNQGKVNWSHPFTNPNSDTPALSEKVASNFENKWSSEMDNKDMASRIVAKFSSISDRLVTASEMEEYCSDCAEKIASGEMEMTWGELREFLED